MAGVVSYFDLVRTVRSDNSMSSPTSDSSPDTTITSCERNEKDDECENNDGDIADDEHDISEIRELQVALEYLISDERRQSYSSINNEAPSTTTSSSTTQQHHVKSGGDAEDETLCMIPNLVNRVLTEHYSPRLLSQTYKRRDISYSTSEKMTQLLIAVIVEFAEPYFVRITKRRDEERKMQLNNKEQQNSQVEMKKKRRSKKRKVVEDENKMQSSSKKVGFEDRAVSWATNCLKVLLQPSLSALTTSDNTEEEKNALDDDLHIPELDAFLAATGANDGNEMEKRMQQALLLGMHGRSMFMSSYIAEWHPNKNF